MAAEQGNTKAQFNLGNGYYTGEGVPQDYKEAFNWYRKAAEQGHSSAQNSLGVMYANGEGVPQNDKEAYIWFSLSATDGGDVSKKNIELIKTKLSPEQLAEAQEQATARYKQIEERQ